jgi:thymidylate kinase
LVIYLRVPAAQAHRNVGQKAAREYTKERRDLQESDLAHLEAASQLYDELARQPSWVTIECYDALSGSLRPQATIHQEVLAAVDWRIQSALQAKG